MLLDKLFLKQTKGSGFDTLAQMYYIQVIVNSYLPLNGRIECIQTIQTDCSKHVWDKDKCRNYLRGLLKSPNKPSMTQFYKDIFS